VIQHTRYSSAVVINVVNPVRHGICAVFGRAITVCGLKQNERMVTMAQLNKKTARGKLFDLANQLKGLAGMIDADLIAPEKTPEALAAMISKTFESVDAGTSDD